ncbi:hypothetical protein KA005_44035, partial [bacterium]|nr:hypothetical protein [bacterium]
MLEPGEVREGWVSCLAPDVPLEDIRIHAWYNYIEAAQPTPTPGPSPTPLSGISYTIEECEASENCVVIDNANDFNSPECLAAEICLLRLTEDPLPTPNPTELVLQATSEAERYLPQEAVGDKLSWSYSRAISVPEDGIRLESVQLTFLNAQGKEKEFQGSIILHSPKVSHVAGKKKSIYGLLKTSEFLFVSRVSVDPETINQEDLQGYTLSRIGALVDVYDSPDAPISTLVLESIQDTATFSYEKYLSVNYWYKTVGGDPVIADGAQPFLDLFLYEPNSSLDGYVLANLEPVSYDFPVFETETEQEPPLPSNVWFRVRPTKEGIQTAQVSQI